MATIQEIIERVDDTKPNAFTQKVKMAWIAELDGRIAADVMLMNIDEIRAREFKYPDDLESEPLVSYPHQDIYVYWLEAKIDYANGEYTKYQNSMEMYNQHYGNFLRWFASTYEPIRGYPQKEWPAGWEGPPYYITAYGLAVKQGYQGTLDEWLNSLKGARGDPASLENGLVEYQVGDSGTEIPSGSWSESIPFTAQGKFLWVKVTMIFNTGLPIEIYSVSRMGLDGSGSVSRVAGVEPVANGNIPLTAFHINALSADGGVVKGQLALLGPLILTEGVHYGTEEPSTGVEGQMYLVEITE